MIGYKSKEFFSEHEDMSIPFKYCRLLDRQKEQRLVIVFEKTKSDYQVMASYGQKPSDYSSRANDSHP